MTLLLTGATGNLGPAIAQALAPHRVLALARNSDPAPGRAHVVPIHGTLDWLPHSRREEIETIIHAAACTAFTAPLAALREANVAGTRRLLDFAQDCPRLRKFLHISTTCVCGDRTGRIPEAPLPAPSHFVNAYEQTKWEAEHLVLASSLPVEIARLATVAGSEHDGSVRRPGALHHTLHWLYKGLIPMIPGAPGARVDLISTELAAQRVAALALEKTRAGRILHVSAGEDAPALTDLLDFLADLFTRRHRAWSSGTLTPPDIVDGNTFALFHDSVRRSGDALFTRICAAAQSFLPALLHPRTMETSMPVRTDWRALAEVVAGRLIDTGPAS